MLKEQMERNIFAYDDDIVVASRKKETQLQDLAETFAGMRRAQLKLNLDNYMFGLSRGKVLGCLVPMKGIEADLDKITTRVHMKPRVQKGSAVAHRQNSSIKSIRGKDSRAKLTILQSTQRLRHFRVGARTTRSFRHTNRVYTKVTNISKSTIRSTTHSVCFGNAHYSEWSPLQEREILKEDKMLHHQVPIYFVFQALSGSKMYYSKMENICYAMVMSVRKL
jgi:hypothetical protein